jgi:tetratricopeptide (TPR) repeat protein
VGRLLGGLFAFPIFLVAAWFVTGQKYGNSWMAANMALSVAAFFLISMVHQLLGVPLARVIGLRFARVNIGGGKRLLSFRFGQTDFTLGANPFDGSGYLASDRQTGTQWRVIAVGVGSLLTLLLIFVGTMTWPMWLSLADVLSAKGAATRFAPQEIFCFVSLGTLVLLVPGTVMRIAGALRSTDAQLHDSLAVAAAIAEVIDLMKHDNAAAERALQAALVTAPSNVTLRCLSAAFALQREQLTEARGIYRELLANPALPPYLLPAVKNDLAWTNYRLRAEELRAEADQLSLEASNHFGFKAHAKSTRGAVLLWMGKYDEAAKLLDPAYRTAQSDNSRALIACNMAMALAHLGELADAGHWLDRARKRDAKCVLLAEAEALIVANTPK